MSTTLRRNRRPPRDPSAATRPMNALEKAAMKSFQFRQKVQQANATTICNSTSDKVGRMPLRQVLSMDVFCVPIFQRRYCWTETQWRTLLEDAAGASIRKQHSLGRLTCTRTNNDNKTPNCLVGVQGRSCILDGQQRFTTATILLAAIRDMLEQFQEGGSAFASTIDSINGILFSNVDQMKEWKNQQSALREGSELPFARLVPTFCDRWAYYTAILPADSDTPLPTLLPRPLQAKQFFLEQLQQEHNSLAKIIQLLRGVLDGLNMLYFPVDIDTNQQDGTEDLMVIYERLALRDATWACPTRKEEYQSMDGSDMIRNLLLGSFATESDSLEYYQEYWLPLEQLVAARPDGKTTAQVLQAFLESQKAGDESESKVATGIIGGQIYADFQAWFAERLASSGSGLEQNSEAPSDSIEEKVRQVGKDLLEFADALQVKNEPITS